MKCREKVNDISNNKIVINNSIKRRPSIRAGEEMEIKINGELPIGIVDGIKIKPSEEIVNKIIPSSEKYFYPYYMWSLYPNSHICIYWELFDMYTNNPKRANLYKQIFG